MRALLTKIHIATFLTFILIACSSDTQQDDSANKIGDSPNSDFSAKDLSGKDLSGLFLAGSNFSNALLEGTDLSNAQLSGANFMNANLAKANLSKADLTNVDFSYANLDGADLTGAVLISANLDLASMNGTKLSNSLLTGAKFRGTDLRSAVIEETDFENSIATNRTLWPAGFKQKDSGVILEEIDKWGGGGLIAFQEDLDGNWDLFLLDTETDTVKQLTDDDNYNYDPALSPDLQKLAFVSNRDGNEQIFIMNALGSEWLSDPSEWEKISTNNGVYDLDPTWSYDGSKIAFTRTGLTNSSIYLMNPDGSDQRLLVDGEVFVGASHPSWSPDGKSLAFSAWTSENISKIYTTSIENPDPKIRFNTDSSDYYPSWSPTGDSIAFMCGVDGNGICLGDSTDVHVLTEGQGSVWDSLPSWSPDGSLVIFRHIIGGISFMGQIDAEGNNADLIESQGVEIRGAAPGNWVSNR